MKTTPTLIGRFAFDGLCSIVCSWLFVGLVVAQGTPPPQPLPARQQFLFHLYVDPVFGDDAEATRLNPTNLPPAVIPPTHVSIRPLDLHPKPARFEPLPSPGQWVWDIAGVAQQAPYAFRTLTGNQGALQWVEANFPDSPSPGIERFPWANPNNGLQVTGVVIHLLPGLYGPRNVAGAPDIDPESGIPFNGETWPARIRNNVSLQGASALDVVLDARFQAGPIIEMSDSRANGTGSWLRTFVDSLSLRNARASEALALGSGAAIYAHSRGVLGETPGPCRAWITNCFISNNSIGIGLDSYAGNGQGGIGQRLHVVNNTIAWNAIGLWAGRTVQSGPSDSVSIHAPLVVNNIFDSGSPSGYIQGLSGFEGVNPADKQVASRGGSPVNGVDGLDFNAWEATPAPRVDLGTVSIPPNWPIATISPPASPAFLGPRVDIGPFTISPAGRPGSLYVNDILRRSPVGGVGVEYSSHDFRLSPNVSLDSNPPIASAVSLNPLVNRGIDGSSVIPSPVDTVPVPNVVMPIVMVNGRAITGGGPGLPNTSEDVAEVHGWDWDGEGYGNPRIEARSGFAIPDPGAADFWGSIDLGADEMGELIMAGYTPGTRIFTDNLFPGAGGAALAHTEIYYFNVLAGGPYPRPGYGAVIGELYGWYDHVQAGADIAAGTANLTSAPLPNTPLINDILLLTSAFGYTLTTRQLGCDYSPSLFPDPHPYWPILLQFVSSTGLALHPYAANCWYACPDMTPSFPALDNPFVYNNLSSSVPHASPYSLLLGWFFTNTAVADATINPPGTFAKWAINSYVLFPVGPFGAFSPCSTLAYSVGAWGFGDASPGCPDGLPFLAPSPDQGVRINCELPVGFGNLQSFLVIASNFDGGGPVDPPARSSGWAEVAESMDRAVVLERLRQAYRSLQQSQRSVR